MAFIKPSSNAKWTPKISSRDQPCVRSLLSTSWMIFRLAPDLLGTVLSVFQLQPFICMDVAMMLGSATPESRKKGFAVQADFISTQIPFLRCLRQKTWRYRESDNCYWKATKAAASSSRISNSLLSLVMAKTS